MLVEFAADLTHLPQAEQRFVLSVGRDICENAGTPIWLGQWFGRP